MTTLARRLADALSTEIERLLDENSMLLVENPTKMRQVNNNPAAPLHPILEAMGTGTWCCSGNDNATDVNALNFQVETLSYAAPQLLSDEVFERTDSGLKKDSINDTADKTSSLEESEEYAQAQAEYKAIAVKKALSSETDLRVPDEKETTNRWSLKGLVTGGAFEAFFGVLIFMNAACMALSSQYHGMDMGFDFSYPSYPNRASDTWRGAEVVLDNLEIVFGSLFVFELLLKIAGLRREFANSLWNLFDTVVVASWVALQAGTSLVVNPMLLRLMRLVRLARLVRMVRNLEVFDSLRIFIRSLGACLPVLLWTALILFLVEGMVGLCFNSLLTHWIKDVSNPQDQRETLFEYFGTFSRSMITMTELTLGNFVPVCRFMVENVNEWYGHLLLVYKVVVGFALIRVASGVFLLETFKAASSDDDLMLIQKKRAQKRHEQKMMRLFNKGAVNEHLHRDGFVELLQDKSVLTWLAAQEIEVRDGNLLFDLMDGGDQRLSASELIKGLGRLKGTAKSLDLVALMHLTAALSWQVSRIDARLQQQESHVMV